MQNVPVRTILAVLALVFSCGAYAQDKSGGERRLSSGDRSFIMQATNGGMVEVTLSKFALQKSARPDVKDFAKTIVDDHDKAGMELSMVAAKLGAPPYKPAVDEHADMKRFGQLAGEKFDSAYIERMVRDHGGTVALFEKQASHGDAGELKAFATKTLPVLKMHLEMIKTSHKEK